MTIVGFGLVNPIFDSEGFGFRGCRRRRWRFAVARVHQSS
jgi:hypothetical protein